MKKVLNILVILVSMFVFISCGNNGAKIKKVALWNENKFIFASVQLEINSDDVESVDIEFKGFDEEDNEIYSNVVNFQKGGAVADYIGSEDDIASVDAKIVKIYYKE